MVQVRFKTSGANSMLGGFASGDHARVSEAFARHLVEEARVAEYVAAPAAVAVQKQPKPKRTKAKAGEQTE